MRLYLVRHGEAQDDVEDCYGGIADFELTDLGRETARQLAAKLEDKGISRIYSSPYKRASETAQIVADLIACEVRMIQNLRERNSYGVLSGVNKDRAKSIFGHVIAALPGKPGDYYSDEVVPGAEPLREFDDRVRTALHDIARDASDCEAICVVTHGNVTRSIYKNLLKAKGKVALDLLAMTELEWDGASPRVLSSDGVTLG